MGVRIIQADGEGDSQGACLYCSTSMWAFGPIFEDRDQAEAFLQYLGHVDPRTLSDGDLETKYADFLVSLEEQEKAEQDEA
jgi:hypothetical protein